MYTVQPVSPCEALSRRYITPLSTSQHVSASCTHAAHIHRRQRNAHRIAPGQRAAEAHRQAGTKKQQAGDTLHSNKHTRRNETVVIPACLSYIII